MAINTQDRQSEQYRKLAQYTLKDLGSSDLVLPPALEKRLFEVALQVDTLLAGSVPYFDRVVFPGRGDADMQKWAQQKRFGVESFFARVPALELDSKYFDHYFGKEVIEEIKGALTETGGVFTVPTTLTDDPSYSALMFAIATMNSKKESSVRLIVSSGAAPRVAILADRAWEGVNVTDVRKPWNFERERVAHSDKSVPIVSENRADTEKVKADILDCNGKNQKACLLLTEEEANLIRADRGLLSKLARIAKPTVTPLRRVTPIEFPEHIASQLDVGHRDILLGVTSDEVQEKAESWGQSGQEQVLERLVRTALVSSFLQPRHLVIRGDYGVGKSVATSRARRLALRAGAACFAADESTIYAKASRDLLVAAGNSVVTTLAENNPNVFSFKKPGSLGATVWVDDGIATSEIDPRNRALLETEHVALVGLSNASEQQLLRFCDDVGLLEGSVDIIECPGRDWNSALLDDVQGQQQVVAMPTGEAGSAPKRDAIDKTSSHSDGERLRMLVKELGIEDVGTFDEDSREYRLTLGSLPGRVVVCRVADGGIFLSFTSDSGREEIIFDLLAREFTASGKPKKEQLMLRKNTLKKGDWQEMFNEMIEKLQAPPATEVVAHPKFRKMPHLEKQTSSNAFTAHCAHILFRLFDLHPFPQNVDRERRGKGPLKNRRRFTVSREGELHEVDVTYQLQFSGHADNDQAHVSVATDDTLITFGFSPQRLFGDAFYYADRRAVESPSPLHPRKYVAESYESPKYTRRLRDFIVHERPSLDMKFERPFNIGKWENVDATAMLAGCWVDGVSIEAEDCPKNVEKQGMEAIEAFDLLLWNLQHGDSK